MVNGINWSNGLDLFFGLTSITPVVGWAIGGSYYISDIGTYMITGQTIGENIEGW